MKPANSNFLSLTILLILIILSGYWLWYQSSSKPVMVSPTPRPDFSLPDLQGKMRSNSEWDGKVVVVNFWATWCPPCVREIPHFIEMQQQYADKGLQFIGVAIDNPISVQQFANKTNINYPILVDGSEYKAIAIAQKFGNHYGTLPFTVIVDRQSMIIMHYPGELTLPTLEKMILPLL